MSELYTAMVGCSLKRWRIALNASNACAPHTTTSHRVRDPWLQGYHAVCGACCSCVLEDLELVDIVELTVVVMLV